MRRPVPAPARPRAKAVSRIAPKNGLYLNQSPAEPAAGTAEVLDNWIPTDRGTRVRGGLEAAATIGGSPVVSMFSYNHPTTPALFAASATEVFNISALDPLVAPAPDLTGQSLGYYSTSQIGTVGGEYLGIVNGVNPGQLFDGAAWTTMAITGVSSSDLSAVWLYRSRWFFVERNSLSAWYLPVDSIGGAALSVSMAGVFQRGGSLLFGATWSLDSGDGLDDKCVFISTDGEVAIFEGADPSSATDWRLAGLYDIATPLGINCTMQAGGDLLIATVEGIVPLSQVIQKDPAAIALSAVSRPIESLWTYEAQRATQPVEFLKWSDRGLGVVSLPDADCVLLVNLQTGAWGVARGWVAQCSETYRGKAYIGRADGSVVAIDETGLDVDQPYTAQLCAGFEDFGSPSYKVAQFMRLVFYAPNVFRFNGSIASDFVADEFPAAPPDAGIVPAGDYLIWDVGAWDVNAWWSDSVDQATRGITTQWFPLAGAGHVLAPQVQITSGMESKPNIELVRIDMMYEDGGVVV